MPAPRGGSSIAAWTHKPFDDRTSEVLRAERREKTHDASSTRRSPQVIQIRTILLTMPMHCTGARVKDSRLRRCMNPRYSNCPRSESKFALVTITKTYVNSKRFYVSALLLWWPSSPKRSWVRLNAANMSSESRARTVEGEREHAKDQW